MALRLMGHIHPLPAGLGAVNQPQLLIGVQCPERCLPRGRGQLDPTNHLLGQLLLLGLLPAGAWVLSMANCDDKAMDTLGTLWNSNWEVGLSPSAFRSF